MSAAKRVAHAAETIRARWEQRVASDPQTEAAQSLEDSCQLLDPEVAAELKHLREESPALRARVAELEAQRERRRVRLVALQNDALSMRGSLSPMGEGRKVPFPLGETLTPAVDWLIARVAELDALVATTRTEAIADVGDWLDERGEKNASYLVRTVDIPAGREMKRRSSFSPTQVLREDVYESPLHHDYRVGHDLPKTGGGSC